MQATSDATLRPRITHHRHEVDRKPRDFFEAMLRDDENVDDMVCDDTRLLPTIQKLLTLAAAGLLLYGLAIGMVMEFILPGEMPGTPIIWMPLTLTGGFLAAIAICLPSFYFYTQLSGLDASFRLITAQSLRVQARTSIFLLGLLPFYLAWALSPLLGLDLAATSAELVFAVGILLPFLVGLAGLRSIYRSFKRLVTRLPITHPRRGNIMLRLVLCWGAVLITVAPVAMFRIGEFLMNII